MSIQVDYNRQALCQHCDLVVELPFLEEGQKASCPRCGTKLYQYAEFDSNRTAAYAVTALVLLAIASCYFFIRIDVASFFSSFTLPGMPQILIQESDPILLAMFLLFTLAIPVYCLVASIILCLDLPVSYDIKILLLRGLKKLRTWSMAEIFIVGTLISFVKLTNYGNISVGISFGAYCIFCLILLKSFISIDPNRLWRHLTIPPKLNRPIQNGKTGIEQGVKLCHDCRAILDKDEKCCPRCKAKSSVRRHHSMQFTVALLITALILYFPANIFPVMTTVSLGDVSPSTIIAGASYMWRDGDYFVATIIIVASIMIPSLKIMALAWLCWFAKQKTPAIRLDCEKMGSLYKKVEYVGRWSMIDVFVVIVSTGVIRISGIMEVHPNIGVIYFAFVVIITMFASKSFDSRLIWDRLLINEA